jgi:hypothetical protein
MTLLVDLGESPDSPGLIRGIDYELNNKPAVAN